ncbi:MAG: YceI family protein [Desulfovibrionaceae bacterium]|jgi:polyisoprenoid-binding protein YceI
MHTLPLIFAVCAFLFLSPASVAEAGDSTDKPVIDLPHTSVTFNIKHILAPVFGRFDVFQGEMAFDPDNLKESWIKLTISVASIDTGVAQRDGHLRTPDFFDAEKYPDIVFESRDIVRTGEGEYTARGRLTMKGVTKELDVPFRYLGEVKHPNPQEPCTMVQGVEASFSVNRLDFGVGDGKFYKMGMVGDMVTVRISMEILSKSPDCGQ